ncbi:MAG: hypothetical protein Q9226_004215 [Calogaya cf. arnoldii]
MSNVNNPATSAAQASLTPWRWPRRPDDREGEERSVVLATAEGIRRSSPLEANDYGKLILLDHGITSRYSSYLLVSEGEESFVVQPDRVQQCWKRAQGPQSGIGNLAVAFPVDDDPDPFPFTLPGVTGDRTVPDAPLLPDLTVAESAHSPAGVEPGPPEEVCYQISAPVAVKDDFGKNTDNNTVQEAVLGPKIHNSHDGNDIPDVQKVQDIPNVQEDVNDHEYDVGDGPDKDPASASLFETAEKAVAMLPKLCRLGNQGSSSTPNVGTSLEPHSIPEDPKKRRAELPDESGSTSDDSSLQPPRKRVHFGDHLTEVREFEKEEEIEVGGDEDEDRGEDEDDDANEGDDGDDDEAEEESRSPEQATVTGNYTQVVDIEHPQPEGDGPTKMVTRSQKGKEGPEPSQGKGKPSPATLSKAPASSTGESKEQAGPKENQKEKPSLEKSTPKRKPCPVSPSKSKVDKPWEPVARIRKGKVPSQKSSVEGKESTPPTPAKQRALNTRRKQQQELAQDVQVASEIERTGALSKKTAEERRVNAEKWVNKPEQSMFTADMFCVHRKGQLYAK